MTVPEYSRRMNRVLDYIDRNLDQDLDLRELAGVAHFSAYHFHRLCCAWLGETLGDYIQRRRLALAAERLAARRDLTVLAVAVSVGFGSGEAFARAFKRHFGCTPTAWRADAPQRWATQLAQARAGAFPQHSNFDQTPPRGLCHHPGHESAWEKSNMTVRLIDLPPTGVAYLRHLGPYGAPVATFWREAFMPWLAGNGLADAARYGIPHDDRSLTDSRKCRFDAAVAVPDGFVATGKATLMTLPGGRYAAASFKATPATIGHAWIELFRGWLPASGMQCDARPLFAYYPPGTQIDPATGTFDCELCLPVCPL